MTTKLETMVGYLAGRGVDDQFLDELADPNSEASRFLEATQARSKALLAGPSPPEPFEPEPEPEPEPSTRSKLANSKLGILLLAVVALIAIGVVSWRIDVRFRQLESLSIQARAESEATARQIETNLARLIESRPEPPSLEPVEKALGRLDTGLIKLERRLDGLDSRFEASKTEPMVAEIRESLIALRRELSASEKTRTRQIEEMQATIHELGRVLRLLLNRIQPPAPTTEPPTGFPPARPALEKGTGRQS